MIGQGELRTPHASRLTPHASRLTPHASRLTPHASRRALTRTKTICPPFGGHNKIEWDTLHIRRTLRDQTMFYKVYHGQVGISLPPSLHLCCGQQDKVSPRVQAADYPSKLLTLSTLLLRSLHTRVECSTHECRYCSHCESISISSAASDQNTLDTSLPFLALHG